MAVDGEYQQRIERIQALIPEVSLVDQAHAQEVLARSRKARNREVACKHLRILEERLLRSQKWVEGRRKRCPQIEYPEALPTSNHVEEIRQALLDNQVIIVAGETGSGKSTQLPKICLDAGIGFRGKIGCTQPRRVAATSVSRRIAEEMGVKWGTQVGCKIRFLDNSNKHTLIKMMTDGMLLAEIQNDPDLLEYELILIDEAHERSLNIDFLLGYLRPLLSRRPELKLIITSATIDTEKFSEAFNGAPVFSISGRTFPVELRYAPVDSWFDADQDMSWMDAAAQAVKSVLDESARGDVLVFLPTEKDIRELKKLLEGRRLGAVEILPLYGRLPQGQQEIIFKRIQKRKLVLATNIAETSITVPGIRYVVDTGYVRISRYNPVTHTQRLPIERISRSSADQRKGRCGRVEDGICIRLYSEKDYLARSEHTLPEIQRSNLASVILQMMYLGIKDIENFPFIDPPRKSAVTSGMGLLRELGAINREGEFTDIGRRLAQLPVDPTVGRMLLQAGRESSLTEVLIIAAGLSIQDPREFPEEKEEQARSMHRKFISKESDFITLLNIWNAYHDACERATQSQLRRFCRTHFLSYKRMREWIDIHDQLKEVLGDFGDLKLNQGEAEYHSIHRALLAGLLGNVAQREKGNEYRGARGKVLHIFPGSGLYDRRYQNRLRKKKKNAGPANEEEKAKTPPWILAAAQVETSRPYARTVAGIDPRWLMDLGAHLLKESFTEPAWNPDSGRVAVSRSLRLYGLLIQRKQISYRDIDPEAAKEIFIREALVAETMRSEFAFFEYNKRVRERVETIMTRMRSGAYQNLDEQIYRFYKEVLPIVTSTVELKKWLRHKCGGEDDCLRLNEADLLQACEDEIEANYPKELALDGQSAELRYRYVPGDEQDGVSLRVPVSDWAGVDWDRISWAVPGMRTALLESLLKGLPKPIRQRLQPLSQTAEEFSTKIEHEGRGLFSQLTVLVRRQYGVPVELSDWDWEAVPDYLRLRVELYDQEGETVLADRDASQLDQAFESYREQLVTDDESDRYQQLLQSAKEKYERDHIQSFPRLTLPYRLSLGELRGLPYEVWLGLFYDDGGVHIRVFEDEGEGIRKTRMAYRQLIKQEIPHEFAWLERDLYKECDRLKFLAVAFFDLKEAKAGIYKLLEQALFEPLAHKEFDADRFASDVEQVKKSMRGLSQYALDWIVDSLEKRRELERRAKELYPDALRDLAFIFPKDFYRRIPLKVWKHMPRYLEGIRLRSDRCRFNPQKDASKFQRVLPFHNKLRELLRNADLMRRKAAQVSRLIWLIEEFKVSIFSQELGTSEKVSEKILNELIREIEA